jgi:hypothetical protein
MTPCAHTRPRLSPKKKNRPEPRCTPAPGAHADRKPTLFIRRTEMKQLANTRLVAFGVLACMLAAPALAQKAPDSTESTEASPAKKGGGAKRDCFDFSALTPGTRYALGDTVKAQHALITIRDYLGTGAPPESRGVWITNTKLAGGTAPELRTYLMNAQVVPNKPVKKVTLNIAEASSGGAAPHANIEVNGEKHEVTGGLATINGKVIGKSPAGNAAIVVNLAPATAGNWNVGTLELHATKGKIESFAFGGLQVFIDNVCFSK